MIPLSPLKINKNSNLIKKSPPPSSSSSPSKTLNNAAAAKPQQRQPVIIYTHSPRIIHTHPRDFMALVQKLTGLSRSDDERPEAISEMDSELSKEDNKNVNGAFIDDNSSSLVITDENCSSVGEGQVINSCFLPPIFDSSNPYFSNFPLFTPSSTDFLCTNHPFYNYTDSLFFTTPNLRSSISSSTLEAMNEFREY